MTLIADSRACRPTGWAVGEWVGGWVGEGGRCARSVPIVRIAGGFCFGCRFLCWIGKMWLVLLIVGVLCDFVDDAFCFNDLFKIF